VGKGVAFHVTVAAVHGWAHVHTVVSYIDMQLKLFNTTSSFKNYASCNALSCRGDSYPLGSGSSTTSLSETSAWGITLTTEDIVDLATPKLQWEGYNFN